jgi:DNA-3-methyladenine glycosylase
MYGPPGLAYVYFVYGMHTCLNAVSGADGQPGAVLLRAIAPDTGLDVLRARRPGVPDAHLTDGPAKLCQALGITTAFNSADLVAGDLLSIAPGPGAPPDEIQATPRIGVRGDEEARTRPWRFVWRPAR